MINRATKLRWRRRVRHSQQHVENISTQAEKGIERHLFRRLQNFVHVRRFVLGWLVLMMFLVAGVIAQTRALSRFYQILEPGQGGIYTEGVIGTFTTANPIYATGPVDSSVSRLVFSGLLRYNDKNSLVGDIAQKITTNSRETVYTVKLRDDVYWHDGKKLTAQDVVYTYQMIQKPDSRSPLLQHWRGIKIQAQDDGTVIFTLPRALASFRHSLTTGILPKHILGGVRPTDLRSVTFNTVNPVGSGPFKWDAVQVTGSSAENREEQIGLIRNEDYYNGAPNLDRFVIRAFRSSELMTAAFNKKELSGASGLFGTKGNDLKNVESEYNVPLMGQVMVFLKNSQEILKDKTVRQALTYATDRGSIIEALEYPAPISNGPLLRNQIGHDEKLTQLKFNRAKAIQLLEQRGWKITTDDIRTKNGKKLTFQLHTLSDGEYARVAQILQSQWREIGVDLEVVILPDNQLQSTIAFHDYDALLYGIVTTPDPDVYIYWHSSQADPRSDIRLNLSEYESKQADLALEAGRSRSETKQRALKYKPFLQAWRSDAPAIALYQPRYFYITNIKLYGLSPSTFNSPADRYANVENWAVRQDRVNIY